MLHHLWCLELVSKLPNLVSNNIIQSLLLKFWLSRTTIWCSMGNTEYNRTRSLISWNNWLLKWLAWWGLGPLGIKCSARNSEGFRFSGFVYSAIISSQLALGSPLIFTTTFIFVTLNNLVQTIDVAAVTVFKWRGSILFYCISLFF